MSKNKRYMLCIVLVCIIAACAMLDIVLPGLRLMLNILLGMAIAALALNLILLWMGGRWQDGLRNFKLWRKKK